MTGQPRGTVAATPLTASSSSSSSSQSSDARLAILEQWNKLREVQQKDGCEGTVDHLKSLLDQESTHYVPCMDYLAAIAASLPASSSSSSSSLSSRASSPTSSVGSVSLLTATSSSYHHMSQGSSINTAAAPVVYSDRVNEAWRRKLCEWCFEVVDHFGMEREVVSVAMNYLDRMVAKSMQARAESSNDDDDDGERHLAKRQFQLVAVSSLYIAVKLHGESEELDIDRRSLNVDVFVELSRGFFQSEAIEAMERNILFSLDWHLNPPTPLKFISSLMRLIPNWSSTGSSGDEEEPCQPFKAVYKAVFDIAMYLAELSVCVSTFTFHSKNSVVAYASILCAMEALQDTLPLPYDARVRFVNRTAEATGMLPESEKVRCVRNLLCELCPAIQEPDVASLIMMGEEDIEDDDDSGKSSPICVSRVVPEDEDAIHKHNHFYD